MLHRGIRNNNPLNIRVGNHWLGEVGEPTDTEFEQFQTMFYGVRAGFVLIKRYMMRYHLDTLTKIITRWAPPSENNTASYIRRVASRMGVNPNLVLSWYDRKTMLALVDAMILQESGTTIANNIIEDAYEAVLTL